MISFRQSCLVGFSNIFSTITTKTKRWNLAAWYIPKLLKKTKHLLPERFNDFFLFPYLVSRCFLGEFKLLCKTALFHGGQSLKVHKKAQSQSQRLNRETQRELSPAQSLALKANQPYSTLLPCSKTGPGAKSYIVPLGTFCRDHWMELLFSNCPSIQLNFMSLHIVSWYD